MGEPYRCPTPCDVDCEALCHEWHQPAFKRAHDAEECEKRSALARVWDRLA